MFRRLNMPLFARFWLIVWSIALALTTGTAAVAAKPINVLLIIADDLRNDLGCYGSVAKTPQIDGLAKRGVLFERAYCQQALCNPSRSSFLTGLRPDSLGLWSNGTHFRDLKPNVVTLPELFKKSGYVTRNVGKIFHNWHTAVKGDPQSWSAPEFLHYENHGNDKPVLPMDGTPKNHAKAPKSTCVDVPDHAFFDGRVADEAVRVLGAVKDKPFFLAVGFWKPHAPFNAPKKYWDLYERAALPKWDGRRPKNGPEIARHDSRELLGFDQTRIELQAGDAEEWRHGYLANISYMDAQVGKVLAALEKSGAADNTLIVFMSDHGYHLGEHELWAKTSCYERDAHVPLVIVPPQAKIAGARVASPVELVDLFPTLASLCGLKTQEKLDGVSLQPLLDDPKSTLKEVAFTQHPRPAYFDRTESKTPTAMGYTARTINTRYTEWRDWETGNVIARELYDHTSDPQEMNNLADDEQARSRSLFAINALQTQFGKIAPAKLVAPNVVTPVAAPAAPLDVWPDLAPGETVRLAGEKLPAREGENPPITRVTNVTRPTMTVHRAEKPNGSAMVILPGGGFSRVVPDLEGTEAADWLNKQGVTAFVLSYRTTADPKARGWIKPLQDAERALSLVRSQADQYGLQKDRIGLLGFSAGGQVACRLLSNDNKKTYDRIDAIDDVPHQPDFSILIYPWNMYDAKTDALVEGITVPKTCPPTYIVHTDDDRSSSLGAVLFYAGLKKHAIPAELHVYGNGGHGYGLRPQKDSQISTWPNHAAHWLGTRGLLK